MRVRARFTALTPSFVSRLRASPLRALPLAGTIGAFALAGACYVGPVDDGALAGSTSPTTPDGGVDARPGGEIPGSDASTSEARGLPCDVESLLAARCAGCHSAPLKAPVRLVTYDDLLTKSASAPEKTLAEVAVGRMRSTTAPMPPPPNAPAAAEEIAAMEQWIAAGYPRGACGVEGDGGSIDASEPPPVLVCTSGVFWNSGRKGNTMNPGRACISCHEREEDEPVVEIGGTVYPTFREPDLCFGADGTTIDAHVVITDADGVVFDLPVGPTGNFSKRAGGTPVKRPFRAKVVVGGRERAMGAAQTSGDCNGCHTVNGANGAPGRIRLP